MSPKPKDARRKSSRASVVGKSPKPTKKKKAQNQTKEKVSKPSKANLDQLGELPRSHGADRIFLIARDPHRLYCYWDIDISRHPGGPTYLRTFVGSKDSAESELPVTFESRNHEIPALQSGSRYTVELGYLRGTQWHCLARSATVETPPDHMSETPGTTFTTIPRPTDASSARPLCPSDQRATSPLEEVPLQHRRILEMLLGKNLLTELSSASFSSEEISSRIRLHLEELLSSGSASELLARIPGGIAAFGSSGHSANLPTLTADQLTHWARETLSSFAPEGSWSSWSSWFSSAPEASSFQLSSWAEGVGSHFLSSWMTGSSSDLSSLSPLSSFSSWSLSSDSLSSPGPHPEKAFHLEAEILLKGRTQPGTNLTIDGQPIPVSQDGTFQHHLAFGNPEAPSEVTLVATAPNGADTRRTTLRLDQQTDLVSGPAARSHIF